MDSQTRLSTLLLALLLVAGAWWFERSRLAEAEPAAMAEASPFTHGQVVRFIASAKAAEAQSDPLQRCLDYPDPPGSHWSRETVVAYCRHRTEPSMTLEEFKGPIESGHAADLDRRLAAIENGKDPHPGDRVDLDLAQVFDSSLPQARELADAWTRQLPDSALAHAASGMAYMAAASHARGQDFVGSTSDDKLQEMQRLSDLAVADFERALAIDPKCVAAYSGLIIASRFAGGHQAGLDAGRRAFAIDPASYVIHDELLWLAKPKWGGSREEEDSLAEHAKRFEKSNPLLALVRTAAASDAADLEHCDCGTPAGRAAFAQVFDNVADSGALGWAGISASLAGQSDIALVYLSESMRFNPFAVDFALARVDNLLALGDDTYAFSEAQRVLTLTPHYQRAFSVRGSVYEAMNDLSHAAEDYRTALTLPGDQELWTLTRLGELYVFKTHDWDKGWEIADRTIQTHADQPIGWILRASIQKDQPRPGLHDTAVYFLAHFADDPTVQPAVAQMRAILAQEKH